MYFSPVLEIDVVDEVGPFLRQMNDRYKGFIKCNIGSLGYYMQKEIKREVRGGSPGGASFAQRRPHDIRAKLQKGSAARQWYGQMLRAVGYMYNEHSLFIGWTSKTAARYGAKQEEGFETPVTKSVRDRYKEAGVKLGNKKVIKTPARPFFEPMAAVLRPEIAPFMQRRLNEYVAGNVQYSKKARRKYKVYG